MLRVATTTLSTFQAFASRQVQNGLLNRGPFFVETTPQFFSCQASFPFSFSPSPLERGMVGFAGGVEQSGSS